MTEIDPNAGNPSPGEGTPATPATEGQPATDAANPKDNGQQDGANPQQPEGQQPPAVPEVYEFRLPEGVTLEGERLELAQSTFKELGLTQEKAQGLIDLYVKLQGEDTGALTAAIEAQRQAQIEAWGNEAKQTLGDKYDETVNLARTAVQHVNDPALTDAFNTLGLGNHPAFIRAFAKFGEVLRESKVDGLGGGTDTAAPKSDGDVMYAQATKVQRGAASG